MISIVYVVGLDCTPGFAVISVRCRDYVRPDALYKFNSIQTCINRQLQAPPRLYRSPIDWDEDQRG